MLSIRRNASFGALLRGAADVMAVAWQLSREARHYDVICANSQRRFLSARWPRSSAVARSSGFCTISSPIPLSAPPTVGLRWHLRAFSPGWWLSTPRRRAGLSSKPAVRRIRFASFTTASIPSRQGFTNRARPRGCERNWALVRNRLSAFWPAERMEGTTCIPGGDCRDGGRAGGDRRWRTFRAGGL